MKQIPLTQGMFALVDDDDFEALSKWKWHANKSKGNYYACRNSPRVNKKRTSIKMHRQIMNVPNDGLFIDHINGNGLDNRRENLRLCTNAENTRNSRVSSSNTTGYRGVSLHGPTKKFRARIKSDDGTIYLGHFKTAIDAALAYDFAAKRFHGEFARLNFPKQ